MLRQRQRTRVPAARTFAQGFAATRYARTDPAEWAKQMGWIGGFLTGKVPADEAVATCGRGDVTQP